MRIALLITLSVLATSCSRSEKPASSGNSSPDIESAAAQSAGLKPAGDTATGAPQIQPWSPAQQEQLLGRRLEGGMSGSFGQHANMFLVMSRIHLGCGVGLVTPSKEVAEAELQSPFPEAYKPTLREYMDAIALQTFSTWKYDPSSTYFKSDIQGGPPVRDLAIFEFTRTQRAKPYQVTLAEGWKAIDKGSWLMLVPPKFPVGMDVYEMGTYSSDKNIDPRGFSGQIRTAVALEWAHRVREDAREEDLQAAHVGPYDALYFESLIPSQLGKDVRWRQWVFMVDHQCYFIVSTILPELDDEIFPDVKKMVASFRHEQP
jgi:hypothetical protein